MLLQQHCHWSADSPSGLQAAIDTQILRLPASGEASMGPMAASNVTFRAAAAREPQSWTQWGAAMPTGSYVHNNFYQVCAMLQHGGCLLKLDAVCHGQGWASDHAILQIEQLHPAEPRLHAREQGTGSALVLTACDYAGSRPAAGPCPVPEPALSSQLPGQGRS